MCLYVKSRCLQNRKTADVLFSGRDFGQPLMFLWPQVIEASRDYPFLTATDGLLYANPNSLGIPNVYFTSAKTKPIFKKYTHCQTAIILLRTWGCTQQELSLLSRWYINKTKKLPLENKLKLSTLTNNTQH